MIIRRALTLIALATVTGIVACDEDDVTGPGFVCDVTNPVGDLFLSPSNAQVLVHVPALPSDTVVIATVVTSRFGTPRSDVRVTFRSSDPAVATVNDEGVVQAVAPGTTRITASACGESSSAQITVLPNVVSVSVTPSSDTVVAGDSASFTARAFGQGGVQIRNVKFVFTSTNPNVVVNSTSDSSATVTSPLTAGSFTINATTEGVTGTATLLALPRIFLSGTVTANGIDVGDATTCGIISAGQAFCWGLNNYGQLGAQADSVCFADLGTPGNLLGDSSEIEEGLAPCSLLPLRIAPEVEFATISAGDSTSCGLSVAGRAYCWGDNTSGQVGNGRTGQETAPVVVTTAQTFTAISVGGQHTCALAAGGRAYCWGDDGFGQLGDRRIANSTTPIPVVINGPNDVFTSISAGWRHTCALQSDGSAWCWGSNERGQLGVGSGITGVDFPLQVAGGLTFSSISAGGDHTCGITTGGSAFCWGSNLSGQLGTGNAVAQFNAPVAVAGGLSFSRISASTGTASTLVLPPFTPWKVIGRGHTCGLTTGGAVFCWGDDTDLQLGRGPFTGGNGQSSAPVQVTGGELPAGAAFVSVSVGSRHSCGVASDGAAYCWGSSIFGALGNTFQAHFRGQPRRVSTPR